MKRNYFLGDHKLKRPQETFLQQTESFMDQEIKQFCTIGFKILSKENKGICNF